MIIGIGTDFIEVKRIAQAIARNPRFLHRVFTEAEIAYCQGRGFPETSFAARFAAKEAVSKAFGLGIGQIGWKEIEIVNDENGQPVVQLLGNCAMIASERAIGRVLVSLSHTKGHAMAMVILEGVE